MHSLRAADCRMCKCQACDFCIGSCASGLLGDTEYTSCEPACDGAIAAEHCNYCRCKECKFCDTGDTASAVSTVQAREPRIWVCSVATVTEFPRCRSHWLITFRVAEWEILLIAGTRGHDARELRDAGVW